ncbi:MAG TPA: hypothetical protein VKE49_07685 [Myxococcaceae bacterium]|nr:hypothetical protein [Myxococcaceae bacterium]
MENTREAEASRLREVIAGLSPRSAQLLELRFVAGLSREECAKFYGISAGPLEVALLRAGQELARQLSGANESMAEPMRYPAEIEMARALSRALEAGDRPPAQPLASIFDGLQRVHTLAAEIRSQNAAAELEAQTSPRIKRRNFLWRLLLLAMLGAGVFLYLRPRPPLAPNSPFVPRPQR